MEMSGTVLRRSMIGFGAGFRQDAGYRSLSTSVACPRKSVGISARPRGVSGGGNGFSDEGHMQYYTPPVRCGVKKKEGKKKRARLVKGLSKDLSAFYSMGFGIEDGDGMVGEVKGKMISEAADRLLSQLKQLRAEEKELKRKRKQEKTARKKDDTSSSSSSSSESSDSDCGTVVRMSSLRTSDLTEPNPDGSAALIHNQAPLSLEPKSEEGIEESLIRSSSKPGLECSCSSSNSSISDSLGCSKSSSVAVGKAMDRIEVCMGGKCKKSGALELMAEFERMVGDEAAVVGCKCMGKCRNAPNVRVLNDGSNEEEDYSLRALRNPLCIGVGLEDVGTIVANFFGEKKDVVGLIAA